MSTKIYNGYKLPLMSFAELSDLLIQIRSKMRPVVENEIARVCSIYITDTIDRIHLDKTIDASICDYNCPISGCWISVNERYNNIKKTQRRDPECDFGCEASLLSTNDGILSILYAEKECIIDVWESFSVIKKYPYWNNIDHPDDISYEEWQKRGDEWEAAISKEVSAIPSMNGMTAQITLPWIDRPLAEQILIHVPSFEIRVKKWATDSAIDNHIKENGKIIDSSNFMKMWHEAVDWTKTEDGKKFIESSSKEIAKKIPENISVDLMKMKIPEHLREKRKCCGGKCQSH